MFRRLSVLAVAMAMLPVWGGAVHAQDRLTAYRCVDRAGHVSYQDTPCPAHSRQHRLDLKAPPPPTTSPPPAPLESSAQARMPEPPPTPAPRPSASLPALYQCVRATNGERYVSRNGHPRRYRVPLNVLGWDAPSLTQAYGSASDPKPSASEFDRNGRVMSRLIGGPYTWVRDRCRLMSPAQTCRTLRDQYETVEHRIHEAFKSDRPPLEKREKQLQSDLSGC